MRVGTVGKLTCLLVPSLSITGSDGSISDSPCEPGFLSASHDSRLRHHSSPTLAPNSIAAHANSWPGQTGHSSPLRSGDLGASTHREQRRRIWAMTSAVFRMSLTGGRCLEESVLLDHVCSRDRGCGGKWYDSKALRWPEQLCLTVRGVLATNGQSHAVPAAPNFPLPGSASAGG